MTLADVTASGVRAALDEFDAVGRQAFLAKYGFGPSAGYWVVRDGRRYDSKAIAGAAHGYDRPDLGPLPAASFSGGSANTIARLVALGVECEFAVDPARIRDHRGVDVDATFGLSGWSDRWRVTLHSRGGTKGTPAARNTEYRRGLELLLGRLASQGAVIEDAVVASQAVQTLAEADRRLVLSFPIALTSATDVASLAAEVGRAQTNVGRSGTAKGGGNPTRRIELSFILPAAVEGRDLLARLRGAEPSVDALEQWLNVVRSTPKAGVRGAKAPHQAVTLLWLAGRALDGLPRMVRWSDAAAPLGDAIAGAGGAANPEYPLVALARSGAIDHRGLPDPVPPAHGSIRPLLNRLDPSFGLPQVVEEQLRLEPAALGRMAATIADELDDDRQMHVVGAASGLDVCLDPPMPEGNEAPGRRERTVRYVQRCRSVADRVKALYDHTCQRCGVRLDTPAGPIADAAHIYALGDGGRDVIGNVICLCPNHHRTFDRGGWWLGDDLRVIEMGQATGEVLNASHELDLMCIARHRASFRDS